jgi:hypothetical protein
VRTGSPSQKTAYIDPELLSSGLVVGGCCITTGGVTYIPVINVNDEGVNVKRGESLVWGLIVEDENLLFSIFDEELGAVKKKNVSKTKEDDQVNMLRDKDVRKALFDESQRLDSKKLANKKDDLETLGKFWQGRQKGQSAFKAKGRQSCDLMDELEFEQYDRLVGSSVKHKIDDNQLSRVVDKMVSEAGCPQGLKPRLKGILWENREVLAETNDTMGLCTAYKPRIPLNTNQPVFTPQYQIPFQMRQAMSEAIKAFLKIGVIQPSSSPYNSPSLMVPKRDGGFRLVVDFRRLNKHVVTDFHPLPRIQQIMETLHEAQYFTVLDLLHGFYNLEIDENDREKTAFSTHDGHWEFIRLPMGLKNSPSIFQRLMQIVLSGCLGSYAFIYIDDILIHSKTAEGHLRDLTTILQRLKRAGLRIKASKCQLFKTEVEYLGFLTGRAGLKVNPRKMEAITNFPRPTKVRDVQAFLGLIGYFRIFVRNFAERARPLYQLLKQDHPWNWSKECDDSFLAFKKMLSEAPVLAFPDFSKPLILTTDASGYATGAILSQIQDGKERIIASASKVFSDQETRYSNTEREMTAVVYGIDHFKSYLWGNKFVVYTDNNAVAEIARQGKTTSRKAFKWYTILHEYDFVVKHRDGKTMPHVDALSRYPVRKPMDKEEIHYLSPSWQTTEFTPILDISRWRHEMNGVVTPTNTAQYEFE